MELGDDVGEAGVDGHEATGRLVEEPELEQGAQRRLRASVCLSKNAEHVKG